MLMNLPERYALIPLLPQTGNFQALTRLKNLRTLLLLSDEEQEARGLAIMNDQIITTTAESDEIAKPVEIPMHEELSKVVIATLKTLEAEEKMPLTLLDLYERIIRIPDNAVVAEANEVAARA